MISNHPKASVLSARGVGVKYHSMTLKDYPDPNTTAILDWLSPEKNITAKGQGIILFGITEVAYDLSVLIARALIISGKEKFRCVPFAELFEEDTLQYFWEEKLPIVLTNFYPDREFYSPTKYKLIENLLSYYLDNGISLSVHFPVEDWDKVISLNTKLSLNPVFFDRLIKNNQIVLA